MQQNKDSGPPTKGIMGKDSKELTDLEEHRALSNSPSLAKLLHCVQWVSIALAQTSLSSVPRSTILELRSRLIQGLNQIPVLISRRNRFNNARMVAWISLEQAEIPRQKVV